MAYESRSFGLPADALGKIGSKVIQRVTGVAEKRYPFQIESKALADRLKVTFHRLGYSVSLGQSQKEGKESETIVKITRERRRGLEVTIRETNESTIVILGKTRMTGDGGAVSVFRSPTAYDLPGKWLYEDYIIASRVRAVVDEYVKSISSESYYYEGAPPNSAAPRLENGEPLFVGRKREIEEFEKSLESTVRRKPRYVAISGPAGIGKSALLREFQSIAIRRGMLVIRRELDPSLASLQDIALFLMDALDRESLRNLPAQAKITNHVTRFVNDHGVTLPSFFGVGGGGISSQRVTPSANAVQEKTVLFMKKRAQKLISLGVPGAVFLLDDSDHLNRVGSAWAFVKSLFDRINEDTGFFSIVISGTNLFRKAAALDKLSVRRLFNIVRLGPLDEAEGLLFLRQLFSESRGVTLGDVEFQRIYDLSGGHPVVLEVFAMEVVEEFDLSERKVIEVEGIVPRVLSRLGEGFFLDMISETTADERTILEVICSQESVAQLRDIESENRAHGFDARSTLSGLAERGLVVITDDGRYSPFCKLFGEYVRGETRENPLSKGKRRPHRQRK